MDKRYWDNVAADYDDQIHDSFANDHAGIIKRRIQKYAKSAHIACDFGCGIGKYLPMLSKRFKFVYAIDLSQKLLDLAEQNCGQHNNIRYIQSNLSNTKLRIRKSHFAVCANVLIADDRKARTGILKNINRHLVTGGHLLLLVPSTESALYADQRLVEWYRREGATESEARAERIRVGPTLLDGIIKIQGVPTKHYLREEAAVTLANAGFEMVSADKVEYGWHTEFDSPPRWMREPYPWDWLIVARAR